MTATPKSLPCIEAALQGSPRSRTRHNEGETDALWEVTGTCTRGEGRGTGPSTYTRMVEITSGRTVCQQGLAATCKDSPVKAKAVVGERHSVLRMSQYERRRPSNAGRGGARHLPDGGNTRIGRRGSRYAAGIVGEHHLDAEPDCGVKSRRCRAGGITSQPRGVCEQALEPRVVREDPSGKAATANRTREIRPSGMRGGPGET